MITYFGYKFVQEIPLTRLDEFKEHRRLRVFYHKGCTCVNCGIVGTKLIQGDGRGNLHWDIYADCGIALTVDHILPRSKGGSDDLYNLQPMCTLCNQHKGNSEYHTIKNGTVCNWPRKKDIHVLYERAHKPKIGMSVYKRKKHARYEYIGLIIKIVTNPITKLPNYMVQGREHSMYSFIKTYIKKSP